MGRFSRQDADDGPQEKTRWQVIASWGDEEGCSWNQLSSPLEDRAEAWSEFHSAQNNGSLGWTSDAGQDCVGPRLGLTVQILQWEIRRNADGKWAAGQQRAVERSDVDPAESLVDIRTKIRVLQASMHQRSDLLKLGDEVTEQDLCGYCGKPATSYTPSGRPRCDEHGVRE